MGSEPGVDACHVEGVAALREDPDFFSGGELGKADGAVGETSFGTWCEGELRERPEDLLLEAPVGLGMGRVRRREASEPGAAGNCHEAEQAYQGAEQDGQYQDGFGAGGVDTVGTLI